MKKMFFAVVFCLFMGNVVKVTIASDIFGYVYDVNNKALSKVEISTKDDCKVYSAETSGSGHYSLSLGGGTYTVKYQKEGYQTQTNDVTLQKDEKKYVEMVVMIANQIPTLSSSSTD